MNITYRKATAKQPVKFRGMADEALKARLFVWGWQLSGWLGELRARIEFKEYESIVIAYDDGVPVGVCVMISKWGKDDIPTSGTFVRKAYRRMRIGTNLIKKARKQEFYHGTGLHGIEPFFNQFSGALEVY